VKAFGFPVNAPGSGHYGYGVLGDRVRADSDIALLQVTDSSDMTEGFSGGPLLDRLTGLVIGMVDAVARPRPAIASPLVV
jgi:hypothetical protein